MPKSKNPCLFVTYSKMNWAWTISDGNGEMACSTSWFWQQWLLSRWLELFWTSYLAVLCKNIILFSNVVFFSRFCTNESICLDGISDHCNYDASLLLLLKRKVFTSSFFWYVPSPWNSRQKNKNNQRGQITIKSIY